MGYAAISDRLFLPPFYRVKGGYSEKAKLFYRGSNSITIVSSPISKRSVDTSFLKFFYSPHLQGAASQAPLLDDEAEPKEAGTTIKYKGWGQTAFSRISGLVFKPFSIQFSTIILGRLAFPILSPFYREKGPGSGDTAALRKSFLYKENSSVFNIIRFPGQSENQRFHREGGGTPFPGSSAVFTNENGIGRTVFISPFEGEIIKRTSKFRDAQTSFGPLNNHLFDYLPFLYGSIKTSLEAWKFFEHESRSGAMLILTKSDLISFSHSSTTPQSQLATDTSPFGVKRELPSMKGKGLIPLIKNQKIYTVFMQQSRIQSVPPKDVRICEFLVYGDKLSISPFFTPPLYTYTKKAKSYSVSNSNETGASNPGESQANIDVGLKTPGQIIHMNTRKVTLRRGQPLFLSPHAILHTLNGDFVEKNSPIMTLPFRVLTTGDIVQGIPKIEQLFEARSTKNGRFFKESLPSFLAALFQSYKNRPLDQAVRQSFYKVQQIIIDGVQRVYRSQGVTIADKHIEIIVKQMTSKVLVIKSGQTGFLPGEILDLELVEKINVSLIRKIWYEPIVLGITRASLEVDSFLSAASFQQTTKVLSRAAISKKKDFLKGLKENVIVGNLIPAGTGYIQQPEPAPTNEDKKK
jgi:hypothetical protein